MGVDESAFLAANHQHPTVFVTGIVYLGLVAGRRARTDGEGRVGLGFLPRPGVGRRRRHRGAGPVPWLRHCTVDESAARDPGADCFHVTKLGFDAVDHVRRRVQHESSGHRGRRDDPLFRARRVLRAAPIDSPTTPGTGC